MATFSWSDNLKIAFRSCSPCLWPLHNDNDDIDDGLDNNTNNNFSRLNNRSGLSSLSRSDELHGLLANAADSTDTDTETMSLHSNPGRSQRNKKKKKSNTRRRSTRTSTSDVYDDDSRRRITLFGYNLFGRRSGPTPPIQLADDSEDALYRHSSARRGSSSTTTLNRSASTAFDSDAAPLDTDTIAALSSPTSAAAVIKAAAQSSAELEAQRLKEKEERRRRRKERKELKKMAEMLAREGIVGDGDEFEGFQGSGSGAPSTYPRIPDGMLPPVSDSGSGSVSKDQREEQTLNVVPHDTRNDDDDDDDKADLDGSHYARNTSGTSNRGSSGDNDSRSRTSTNSNHRKHHYLPNESERLTNPLAESEKKKKRPKDKHSGSSSRTTKSSSSKTSSSSSSQLPQSPRQLVSPSTIEQGQGFFDLEDHDVNINNDHTPDRPEPSQSRGYLPITGFGGNTFASSRMASNLGAMLAQRGGDDERGD